MSLCKSKISHGDLDRAHCACYLSGATFIILSKAKGWWIVQKDPEGFGNVVPDQSKSGWVPAGKLISLLPRLSHLLMTLHFRMST